MLPEVWDEIYTRSFDLTPPAEAGFSIKGGPTGDWHNNLDNINRIH
jgi:hypothetical protein